MILLAMASFADAKGRNIYASRETIARMALCALRSVDRAIKRFLDDEVISFDRPMKNGEPIRIRTRCYRIHAEKALELYGQVHPNYSSSERHDVSLSEISGDIVSGKNDMMSLSERHDVAQTSIKPGNKPCALAAAVNNGASPAHALWNRCQDVVTEKIGSADNGGWLKCLTPRSYDGTTLVLVAPSDLVRDQVRLRFGPTIEEIIGVKLEVIRGYSN